MQEEYTYQSLKNRQREFREQFPDSLGLRVHRALSWLNKAEQESEDGDARFIFLWIAFNAAYANEIQNVKDFSERKLQVNFLERLIDLDKKKLIYHILWEEFSKSIRLLIDNQFVFQPFWDFQRGDILEKEWQELFNKAKLAAHKSLGAGDTKKTLGIVFSRLYVLRNQLIHGGATWNSSVNRDQIRDGARIMGKLVPVIIHIMMEHSEQLWGDAAYPVVE